MKKTKIQWWMWVALMLLAGCEHEDGQMQPMKANRTLVAKVESNETRTTVDENGNVDWTETDAIGVFGTVTANAKFQSTGSGAGVGFAGGLAEDEDICFAYYPYAADVEVAGNALTLTLPAEYAYTGESQAPMLGFMEDEETLMFKHLGGLLRFRVLNLIDGVASIVLTSSGENAPGLSGKATVSDIAAENPVLQLTSEAQKTIKITFGADKGENKTFCIFVPVGTYPKLTVTFLDKDGNALFDNSVSDVTITRAKLLDMPTVNATAGVSKSYIPVITGEDESAVKSFDSSSGEVVLEFSEDVPVFEAGKSVIVVPDNTNGGNVIRVVKEVVENGDQMTLRTEEGNMTDLFMNKQFTLTTNPTASRMAGAGGELITPYKIVASMPDGSRSVIYDAKNDPEGRVFISEKQKFLEKEIDNSGKTILKKGGAHLYWEKCKFAASLDAQFTFNFGESIKTVGGVEIPKGELNGFFYVLEGDVEADLKLRLKAEQEYSLGTDEPITVLRDVLGPTGANFYFMVGTVPFTVTLNADFLAEASMQAKAEMEMSAGVCAGLNVKMGASYHKDTEPKPEGMITPRFSIYKPELTVKGTVEGDATFYPVYHIGFFQFADVNVSTEPHVRTTFEFGGKVGGEEDELYGGWNSRLYTESHIETDFTLGFAGMTTWSSPELQYPQNPEETDLYISPKELELISPEEDDSFRQGKAISVKVRAKDYSILSDEAYSLAAVVKFTSTEGGELSKEFDFTNIAGEATVDWTPESEEDVLKAEVLGADGTAIATVEYKPNLTEPLKVTSVQSTKITTRGASLHGKVTGMDDSYEYKYGICYSKDKEPTIGEENTTAIEGKDMKDGVFQVDVSGLEHSTTYYWRAYVTEDGEITLGDVKEFKTKEPTGIAVETSDVNGVGGTYATLSGILDGVKETDEYEYGFYYSVNPDPQTGTKVEADDLENGAYSALIEQLESGVTYYWQAYALVNGNPHYGEVKSFSTPSADGDRAVLTAFYNNNGGVNWSTNQNWCTDLPLEDWAGVTTDDDGFVVSIYIRSPYGCYVTGDVVLSGLSRLETLSLDGHKMTSLDLAGCSNLKDLTCTNNELLTSVNLDECSALEYVNFLFCNLSSLDVSDCPNLKSLGCAQNKSITSLNISGCKKLESVDVSNNKIANALDFSNNVNLTRLLCDVNSLSNLNVDGCINLDELMCGSNQLAALDVTDCTNLTYLDCGGNQISSLDLSKNTKLVNLSLGKNQLTNVNLSNCSSLTSLSCGDNLLTELNVSNCNSLTSLSCGDNQLSSLDLRGLVALKTLYCGKNELKNLNVSNLTNLYYFECQENLLTELKLVGCTGMQYLRCEDNRLVNLDLSVCAGLLELTCSNNQLTSLNLTSNVLLNQLICNGNKLTSLDLTNNSGITYLNICDNQLKTIDVSKMLELSYFYTYGNELETIYIPQNFVFSNSFGSQSYSVWGDLSYDFTEDTHLDYYQYPEFIRK